MLEGGAASDGSEEVEWVDGGGVCGFVGEVEGEGVERWEGT